MMLNGDVVVCLYLIFYTGRRSALCGILNFASINLHTFCGGYKSEFFLGEGWQWKKAALAVVMV